MSQSAISALVAARMGSSRFPGKSLADLHGQPMLTRMVERIRAYQEIDQVVLATTTLPEDDALEGWAEDNGVVCFRGSPDDVLGRLRAAADANKMSTIVEMLGDNPLVHSDLIEAAVDLFHRDQFDYVATVTNEYPNAPDDLARFPIGVRIQVISIDALRRCDDQAKDPSNREHATSFIAEHPEIFKTGFVTATGPFSGAHRPELTFAVNHAGNLDLIRALFAEHYDRDHNFPITDAIRKFDADPDLLNLMGEAAA